MIEFRGNFKKFVKCSCAVGDLDRSIRVPYKAMDKKNRKRKEKPCERYPFFKIQHNLLSFWAFFTQNS